MKRTPLERKTPLSSQSQLKKTRLSPRSERTKRLYEEVRVPLVIRLLAERPLCERCGVRKSDDVHEIKSRGRTGGVNSTEWLDESNLACLCRVCHDMITRHELSPEEMKLWLQ